ncbi:MAG: right-handed parallel beta-helix repeat-containing protein [Clostridia bacterium]|nr:right-handed parallel beta-helix repeat-containing protein [Clostridia bacterium]
MKQRFVIKAALLAAVILLLAFAGSCGEKEAKVEMTEFVGWQEYKIMRSDTAGEETVDAAIALRKAAEAKLGTQMALETDWVKRGEEPPVGTKEILIGATNRPESSVTALLYNDYVIEKIGERVVINGGSGSAVLAGVNWFIENCITDGTMQVPAAPYRFHGEYPMAQVMVGGVKLCDYALTGDEREPNLAVYSALRGWIAERTGVVPAKEGANQILFKVDPALNMEDISIKQEGGNLVISCGEGGYSADKAAEILCEKLEARTADALTFDEVLSLPMENFATASAELLADWDAKADARREEILNTPNMEIPAGARVYYISHKGSDANDGKTPETAWRSTTKLTNAALTTGTYVCFERGGVYRGKFSAKAGVTYTAYGEGAKPEIYGSPFNAAEVGTWEEVSKNVWRYSEKIADDIGMVVMNEGEAHGYKMILHHTDKVTERVSGAEWKGYTNLDENYEFWHDLNGQNITYAAGGYLYMFCDKGNPGDIWEQIEFNTRGNVISCSGSNITIDNLCIMYGGSHGIGAGTIKGLTVTNCEVGWIGGSIQYYKEGKVTRYGNGIEIYGGCEDFTIDNCYVYECYDAGITHQYSAGGTNDIIMDGVRYTNNLIENCVYSVEYFLGAPDDGSSPTRYMKDILFADNIMVNAGYGFGAQRPDRGPDAHIKGWGHMNTLEGDFIIENNLFLRSKHMMIDSGTFVQEHAPTYRNNIFAQLKGGQFGKDGKVPMMMYTYETVTKDAYLANTFYLIRPEDAPDSGHAYKHEVLPK